MNSTAPRHDALPPWKLRRVTEYVEARLADTIKVRELAELSGLSEPQFVRLFSRLTGVPPHRWHLRAKIRRAQALLRDTDLPLVEVALIVGFSDQSHFCKVFRRVVGVSPGFWRHAHVHGMHNVATHPNKNSTANDWRIVEAPFIGRCDAGSRRHASPPTAADATDEQRQHGYRGRVGGCNLDEAPPSRSEARAG